MRDAFHPKSLLGLLTEFVLIGVSVFLALLANQWSEAREHRERANATLRYFREEIVTNQKAIETRRQYHEALRGDIESFLTRDSRRFKRWKIASYSQSLVPALLPVRMRPDSRGLWRAI